MSAGRPDSDFRSEREALRDLSEAYAATVDDRDGDAFAALFVADGELLVPDLPSDPRPVVSRRGHAELRRVPGGLRRYRHTFHEVTTARFLLGTGAGTDTATGRVWCVAHHIAVAGDDAGGAGGERGELPAGTDTVWAIRYADDYRRTASGWRFARRALHLLWVEERPVALVGPAPDTPEAP